jgi:phosphate-selective porin OprO/OprP
MRVSTFLTVAIACIATSLPAQADDRWEIWSDGNGRLDLSAERFLTLRFEEPDLRFHIGGRFHGDGAVFDDDTSSIDDDVEVRRGRAYFSGRLFEDWSFKVEYDFAGERAGWRNLWARYKPFKRAWIKGGNFVAPFGLEEVSSSNYTTFMERALPSAISPDYGTGGALHYRSYFGDNYRYQRWSITSSFTVPPLDDPRDDLRHRSDHWAFTSRVTYAPIARKRRVIHLGGSVEYRNLDSGSDYRVRSRPESHLAPAFLDTDMLTDVDQTLAFGAEAAAVLGPVSIQGEYMWVNLDRSDNANPSFDGWYAQVSWALTGESRPYSRRSGSFRGIDPKRKWGAVELAARYSTLDLNDGGVDGGDEDNVTAGLNWYIRRNLRLMFNYIHVMSHPAGGGHDNPEIFQARIAFFF